MSSTFILRATSAIKAGSNKFEVYAQATLGVPATFRYQTKYPNGRAVYMNLDSTGWKVHLRTLTSRLGPSNAWMGSGETSYIWRVKAPIGTQRTVQLDVAKGKVFNEATDSYEAGLSVELVLRDVVVVRNRI
jgi:hypothetical protein